MRVRTVEDMALDIYETDEYEIHHNDSNTPSLLEIQREDDGDVVYNLDNVIKFTEGSH